MCFKERDEIGTQGELYLPIVRLAFSSPKDMANEVSAECWHGAAGHCCLPTCSCFSLQVLWELLAHGAEMDETTLNFVIQKLTSKADLEAVLLLVGVRGGGLTGSAHGDPIETQHL